MRLYRLYQILRTLFLVLPTLVIAQREVALTPDLDSINNLSHWMLDGNGSWKIENNELVLFKAGTPAGPIRRPSSLAILNSDPIKNVTVNVDIQSTQDTSVIHRDLEVILDYQSPTRFYYIHLAGTTDAVHNGIFIVENTDRRRIDSGKGLPQLKDKSWHHVKAVRNDQTGSIAVFMDNSMQPVLQARDTTLVSGRVGFGSFDDTGTFRNIQITGIVK